MTNQNPVRTSVHPSDGERVQPDSPLSGAVKREGTRTDPHGMEAGTIGDTDDAHVAHSIAISLKRIADALHGDEANTGMKHALAEMASRAYQGWGPTS